MTPTLKVLTQYCEPYIDDIRLKKMAITNAPKYAWTLWQYLLPQMARFTIPPEMPQYLFGTENNPQLTEPQFNSYRYVATEELTTPTTIELGTDYENFELFAANIITVENGEAYSTPTALATYDSESGNIVLNASDEQPITQGSVFDFDFYTDGAFQATLSPQIMTILGMCFECAWVTRTENDWLSIVPKVEEGDFSQQNIANRMGKGTERLREVEQKLASEMRKFEKNCHYYQTIPLGSRLKIS